MEPGRSRRCGTTTTLFDLVAAVQDSLSAAEAADGLAVPVVQDLLRRMVRVPPPEKECPSCSVPMVNAQDAAA
jgi:hypothetical protein